MQTPTQSISRYERTDCTPQNPPSMAVGLGRYLRTVVWPRFVAQRQSSGKSQWGGRRRRCPLARGRRLHRVVGEWVARRDTATHGVGAVAGKILQLCGFNPLVEKEVRLEGWPVFTRLDFASPASDGPVVELKTTAQTLAQHRATYKLTGGPAAMAGGKLPNTEYWHHMVQACTTAALLGRPPSVAHVLVLCQDDGVMAYRAPAWVTVAMVRQWLQPSNGGPVK
jgi:hypothetical protein